MALTRTAGSTCGLRAWATSQSTAARDAFSSAAGSASFSLSNTSRIRRRIRSMVLRLPSIANCGRAICSRKACAAASNSPRLSCSTYFLASSAASAFAQVANRGSSWASALAAVQRATAATITRGCRETFMTLVPPEMRGTVGCRSITCCSLGVGQSRREMDSQWPAHPGRHLCRHRCPPLARGSSCSGRKTAASRPPTRPRRCRLA